MRLIRISVRRVMSSSVTSRRSCLQERLQPLADLLQHAFPGLRLLDPAVDALLDEDAFERIPVPLLLEFAELDLEFALEQRLGLVDRAALEDFADAEEFRPVESGRSATITQAAGERFCWQSVKT
jgi:hypothetical protein